MYFIFLLCIIGQKLSIRHFRQKQKKTKKHNYSIKFSIQKTTADFRESSQRGAKDIRGTRKLIDQLIQTWLQKKKINRQTILIVNKTHIEKMKQTEPPSKTLGDISGDLR